MPLRLELRPYQREDVARMVALLAQGQPVLNLNEMRTGKLIECIAVADALNEQRLLSHPILFIAPLSTLWNVREEFARWLGWEVAVNQDRPNHLVTAINREKLRDPAHWLFQRQWSLVIFDEAHAFRGRSTQQTTGAVAVAKRVPYRILTTGTPLMNGLPYEVWPLLRLLQPHDPQWRSFWRYMDTVAANVPGWGGSSTQSDRSPWKRHGRQHLQAHLADHTLRRTYAEVAPDLPPIVRQTIPINLSVSDPEHARLYEDLGLQWRATLRDARVEVNSKLELTHRLLQLTACPRLLHPDFPLGGKVQAVLDTLDGMREQKAVVWCWHRALAALLADLLRDRGPPTYLVTGGVPADERGQACQAFQAAEQGVLVATIASLKEGISLDTAQAALFLEKSWLPAENDQAAARLLGPNQQGSPLLLSFTCLGTIDHTLERVLQRKASLTTRFLTFTALLEETQEQEQETPTNGRTELLLHC